MQPSIIHNKPKQNMHRLCFLLLVKGSLFFMLLFGCTQAQGQFTAADTVDLQKIIDNKRIVQLSLAKGDSSHLIAKDSSKRIWLITKPANTLLAEQFPAEVLSVAGGAGNNFLAYKANGTMAILQHTGAMFGTLISDIDSFSGAIGSDRAGEYQLVKGGRHYRINLANPVFNTPQPADVSSLLKREKNGADVCVITTNNKYRYNNTCTFDALYYLNFEGRDKYLGKKKTPAGAVELSYMPVIPLAGAANCTTSNLIYTLNSNTIILQEDNTGSFILRDITTKQNTYLSFISGPTTTVTNTLKLTGNPFYYSGVDSQKNFLNFFDSSLAIPAFVDVDFDGVIKNYPEADISFTCLMNNYFLVNYKLANKAKQSICTVVKGKLKQVDTVAEDLTLLPLSDSCFILRNEKKCWLYVFDQQKNGDLLLFKDELTDLDNNADFLYLGQRHFWVKNKKRQNYLYNYMLPGPVRPVTGGRSDWQTRIVTMAFKIKDSHKFITARATAPKGNVWLAEIEREITGSPVRQTEIWYTTWTGNNYTPLQKMVTLQNITR